MAFAPGTRLGPYEVTAQIGVGGMGEVYRATDTNLKRAVAIKILPELFAHDSDRLARFQREAKTLASLNHPNIAIIHGLEQAGDVHALVMELVPGEDLSQRIARGPLPLDEALPIAKQIAEALEAAHEQGIIHRDLKPANIKVGADGTVKVLDFGLAKAMEPVGRTPNVSQSPTITTPAMTQAGMIGTAAYMSPEQAKGRTTDKRSDVWAFGCVLYEMLAGKRAFEADDISDTIAAVLRAEPDWAALPPHLPHAVIRLLRRCLEKDHKRRIRDIGDARLELDDAQSASESTAAAAPASTARKAEPPTLRRLPTHGMTGTIERIVSDKGFGFIAADDGRNYFFHESACRTRFVDLREGQAVTFEPGEGAKGPRCENVALVGASGSGPIPPTSPPPTPPPNAGSTQRRINAWITERPDGLTPPLVHRGTYTLNFNVGVRHAGSVLPADAVVPDEDIPAEGLQTDWMVIADGADLVARGGAVTIDHEATDARTVAVARFALLVPRGADSVTITMGLVPEIADLHLRVLIFVAKQLYRTFEIAFERDEAPAATDTGYLPLSKERVLALASEMNLAPPHEWTTPPGELTVILDAGRAFVHGDISSAAGPQSPVKMLLWPVSPGGLAGYIQNVRASAERFRGQHDQYLNDVSPVDLATRLGQWSPDYDWANLHYVDDRPHRDAWEQVSRSTELRDLAVDGYTLFRQMFPGTELHDWFTSMHPGYRLNVWWLKGTPGWIGSVPLGLMYVLDPPRVGEPVDALGFAALRFRIEYRAYDVSDPAKSLFGATGAHRLNVLYWGSNAADPTAQEANAQRSAWQASPGQHVIPASSSGDPRKEVVDALENPQPSPVAVLYLFCQCSVGRGNDLILQFNDSTNMADAIRRTEIGTATIPDHPLVFANACTTVGADPYVANLLESEFFARDCRGFLGTETKVPIGLASRFATVFFRFFERQIVPEPLSAGEAVAQTRLFLWTRYRNIGGLLYTYVNQYELFMASGREIETARR